MNPIRSGRLQNELVEAVLAYVRETYGGHDANMNPVLSESDAQAIEDVHIERIYAAGVHYSNYLRGI